MSDMQYSKVSGVPGLSNEFGQRGGPNVGVKIYRQPPGHVNPDRPNGSAGGEVRRETIVQRGGRLIKE